MLDADGRDKCPHGTHCRAQWRTESKFFFVFLYITSLFLSFF